MADLSDVENALVTAGLTALYPAGLDAASVTGNPIRVYRGWPLNNPLSRDLASGICNVSIFATPNESANTTRWWPIAAVRPGDPTLFLAVSGATVSVSGTAATGQLAGVLADGQPFVYSVSGSDTPAVVAASLAQSIRAQRPCWLSGDGFTIPAVGTLVARCVAAGATRTEWTRQRQGFRIGLWCPSPALRDVVASALGASFAATAFLDLADDTSARLRYRATAVFDDDQHGQLYRRDLLYDAEYGTTSFAPSPSMLFAEVDLNGASSFD